MKGFKRILVLMLVLVLTINAVACTKETGSNNPEPAPAPTQDGDKPAEEVKKDIVIAVNAEVISLDPHNTSDTLSNTARDMMYEGLMQFNKEMEIVPTLAEKYEVSDDGLEYTFYLRKDVKFHDGTEFTAEAVKLNYERVKDESKALRRKNDLKYVAETEVIDDYTVKLHLSEPFAPMLARVAGLMIISPKALENGDEAILKNPVGTGPYVFDKWSPGEGFVVKRNESYWREGPKVDTLTMKAVPENGARIAMLQTGEADFIYPLPTEQINAIKDSKDIEIIEGPSTIARFTFINMSKDIFKDKRVRQAMNHAIDKEAYAKIVKSGYAVPLTSIVPTTIQYHVEQPQYEFNVEKAKQLMAEAGYADGFKTHIWAPNDTENMRGMEFIAQQLAVIGIDVEVTPLEEGTLSDKIYSAQTPEESEVNMWYVSWSANEFDGATNRLFHSANIPPTAPNVSYYMNPKADELMDKGGVEVDPVKRGEIYKELQEIVWDDAPWLFLGSDILLAAQRSTTEGIEMMPGGGIRFIGASTTK